MRSAEQLNEQAPILAQPGSHLRSGPQPNAHFGGQPGAHTRSLVQSKGSHVPFAGQPALFFRSLVQSQGSLVPSLGQPALHLRSAVQPNAHLGGQPGAQMRSAEQLNEHAPILAQPGSHLRSGPQPNAHFGGQPGAQTRSGVQPKVQEVSSGQPGSHLRSGPQPNKQFDSLNSWRAACASPPSFTSSLAFERSTESSEADKNAIAESQANLIGRRMILPLESSWGAAELDARDIIGAPEPLLQQPQKSSRSAALLSPAMKSEILGVKSWLTAYPE